MTIDIRHEIGNELATSDARDKSIARLGEWAQVADAAYEMAKRLVVTQFVPQQYRGKPEEAAAAMLAGTELGLSPMASLRAFDPIQGTPAPKAITLRAVVQAAGHDIEILESSATVARIRGRRKGSAEWQTSEWTIKRATDAGYVSKNPNYKSKPAEMLIARATAEICRWIASDAIMGMPYSAEEIRDEGDGPEWRPPAKRVTAAEILAAEPDAEDDAASSSPPAVAEPEPMSERQRRRMFALLTEKGVVGADAQREYVAKIVGRQVSRGALSAVDADKVIDALVRMPVRVQPLVDETGGADPDGDASWPNAEQPADAA